MAEQPWLVGCDYIPANAINQLEMWQAETFDTVTIAKEMTLAKSIGFNTLRVYLHSLAWEADSAGFKNRINTFLDITSRNGIRPLFVIFDDCWNPYPKIGAQPQGIPLHIIQVGYRIREWMPTRIGRLHSLNWNVM